MVGTGRFELPTCRLGGDRSIHLSYVPALLLVPIVYRRGPHTFPRIPNPSAYYLPKDICASPSSSSPPPSRDSPSTRHTKPSAPATTIRLSPASNRRSPPLPT